MLAAGKEVPMPEMAIQTQKLTRTFGALTAVDSVDLQVTAGQFFGFLGPNGAGKSTTIKILTGLLAPTSGSMQLLGVDFAAKPVEVKRQIGVVPEGMGLFERLTGSEYLKFVGRMYGLDRATTQRRSEELRAGISGEAGTKTTLEQIFLSIVGQDGTERPQLEELSWLM